MSAEPSCGTLLAGRLRYRQPGEGYRTGLEPVLLAAAVPARPGERVLEAGCGAGAGLLCLLHRVPGLRARGIERDAEMAALARANLAENGLMAAIETGDVAQVAGAVDHAFANPPWHDPASTAAAHPARVAAKQLAAGLGSWIGPLAACLAPRGSLTLILPATLAGEAVALLHAAGLGRTGLLPLWPRAGRPAKLLLLQARRGRGSRILAGLVLHDAGGLTIEAEAVLRGGQPIAL